MLDALRIPGFTNKKMKRGKKYQKLPDMHWREESVFFRKEGRMLPNFFPRLCKIY